MRMDEDSMEIQEKEDFPLLLSEKNTETGETTRYFVSISEYHKNLFESVDLMNDEGILIRKTGLFIHLNRIGCIETENHAKEEDPEKE